MTLPRNPPRGTPNLRRTHRSPKEGRERGRQQRGRMLFRISTLLQLGEIISPLQVSSPVLWIRVRFLAITGPFPDRYFSRYSSSFGVFQG